MTTVMLAITILAIALVPCVVEATYSVRCQQGSSDDASKFQCKLSEGIALGADVFGNFYDEVNTTGWSRLFLRSHTVGVATGFAAGYLEGALTANRIMQHLSNYKASFDLIDLKPEVATFIEQNDAWTRNQIAAKASSDSYWNNVSFIYDHMDGIMHGANDHLDVDHQLTRMDMSLLALIAEINDIKLAVDESERVNFAAMSLSEITTWAQRHGHCSALVKLVPDGSELFVGHNTWWSYSLMLRVVKHYQFGSLPPVLTSSFPGLVASADDFYQMNDLVVMETTITVYNHEMLASVSAESLPYWIRAMTANYMAATGPEWMRTFKRYNSGTYNNMWMVVDYSKFEPGSPLRNGILTVGEQLPGYFHFEDQTFALSYGYWPSYNVALYNETQRLSGQLAMEWKHPELSYQQSARAQIFRRDQASVQSDADMQRILRYNKFETDPLAHGNTCNQLACRADLPNILDSSVGVGGGGAADSKPTSLKAFGAIDAKYTSWSHVQAKRIVAIAGPTQENQPVFDWTLADPAVQSAPHLGQPNRFDFDWFAMTANMDDLFPKRWSVPIQSQSQMSMIQMAVLLVSVALICSTMGVVWKVYSRNHNPCGEQEYYQKISSGKHYAYDASPTSHSTRAGSLASSLSTPGGVSSAWDSP